MGSSTPPSTTQTSTTQLSPQQNALFQTAFPLAQQYASTPIKQYSGTGIVPLSPEELAAQAQYSGTAAPAAQNLATSAASTQSKLLDPSFMLDVQNNPYLQGAAQATANVTNKALTENQLPAIASGAISHSGPFSGGSTREGIAEGKAIGDTNQGLSNAIAQQMFGAYQQNQGVMANAVNNNAGVINQQTMPGDIMAAPGAQNRSQDQAMLDEQIQRFYTGQQLPYLQAQELMALLTGMPGASNVSTSTGALPPNNGVMGGLGGAASGAAIGTGIMPGVGTGIGAGIGGLAGYLGTRR